MKLFLFLFSTLLLVGCSNEAIKVLEDPSPPTEIIDKQPLEQEKNLDTNDDSATDEETDNPKDVKNIDFNRYFKPAESTAYFIGEGNEFASYTEKTSWISERYVATIVDNGGAVTIKIFRIFEDKIELISDEPIEGLLEDVELPNAQTLDGLPSIGVYLTGPFKVGTTFGNWTVIEIDTTLKTPYKSFENVFIIEETGEGFTNRKYFVEDYGVIKTESIMSVELDEEFIVTSTLENIIMN